MGERTTEPKVSDYEAEILAIVERMGRVLQNEGWTLPRSDLDAAKPKRAIKRLVKRRVLEQDDMGRIRINMAGRPTPPPEGKE